MGIFDFFSSDDAVKAANDQKASIATGQQQGSTDLNNGINLATDSLTKGIAPFLDLSKTATGGENAYANATGANGPAGNAKAIADFQSNPGYQYTVDQAVQNIDRNKAATGQLASGGTNLDVAKQVEGLANQNWQQYVTNLLPFLNQNTSAASGILTGNATLGTLQNANSQQKASLDYGANVAQGNAQASADMAPYYASKNLVDFGMNAAKGAASIAAFL